MNTPRKLLAGVGALAVLAVGCSSDDDTAEADPTTTEAVDTTVAEDVGTIVDVASADPEFSTLVAAVAAANLVDTLNGPGPYTVFAPTDAAFDDAIAALGVTPEELLADPTLGDILTYHVVAGEVMASDVLGMDGAEVETVNGAPLTISVDGDTVMVNDATVVKTDIETSNGVIHVIDKVLLPPA